MACVLDGFYENSRGCLKSRRFSPQGAHHPEAVQVLDSLAQVISRSWALAQLLYKSSYL